MEPNLADPLAIDNYATRISNWLNRWQPNWCLYWYQISRIICISYVCLCLWGTAFAWLGDDATPPMGPFFRLALLCTTSCFVGYIISQILHIPQLFIMILFGIVFRNAHLYKSTGNYIYIAATLRQMALMVILIRAGLGLDHESLAKLGGMVFRLTIIPATIEILAMTLTAYLILDMPPLWGMLLGCVMGAVSPAVIIPSILSLNDRGYARSKGLSTLIISATGLDDVYAIAVYEIVFSILFTQGEILQHILHGPVAFLVGITYGVGFGLLGCFIPDHQDKYAVPLRIVYITSGSLLAIFGSPLIEFEAAGSLGTMVLAYVASLGWNMLGIEQENLIVDTFKLIWNFIQAFLFPLIGAEVYFSEMIGGEIGKIIASILICTFFRCLSCIFVTMGADFTFKERLFIAISWIPKATVQAALGPVALDFLRDSDDEEQIHYAWIIMIAAVLSIILTAPLGALLIPICGKLLLEKEMDTELSARASIMGSQLID